MDTDTKNALAEQEQRERYADHLQADFYKTESGLQEIAEYHATINCLNDDEAEETFQLFGMEQVAGNQPPFSKTHKIVSDLCWQMAKNEKDLNFLAEHFGSNHTQEPL